MNKFSIFTMITLFTASLASYGSSGVKVNSQVVYKGSEPIAVNLNGATQMMGQGVNTTMTAYGVEISTAIPVSFSFNGETYDFRFVPMCFNTNYSNTICKPENTGGYFSNSGISQSGSTFSMGVPVNKTVSGNKNKSNKLTITGITDSSGTITITPSIP